MTTGNARIKYGTMGTNEKENGRRVEESNEMRMMGRRRVSERGRLHGL